MEGPTSILVADDNESTLKMIASFLEARNFRVIGTAKSGAELVTKAQDLAPDVVVTDISMPELNGVAAISQLRKMGCEAKVVILTVHMEPEFVQAAFSAGASGYVLKSRAVLDLSRAIELALQDQRFVSPTLTYPAK